MTVRQAFGSAICVLVLAGCAIEAQDTSDHYYEAIRSNDLPALQRLNKSSDVNTPDKRGTTPVMYAAAFGSLDSMKLLITAGSDVNAKNAFDATALMWCANDSEKVRLLIAKGANVNARSKQGRTPVLIAASHNGASEIVKLLLDKGADSSVRDGMQTTPLHAAAEANDTRTVRLLLDKGADVNAKNAAGTTALMSAAGHGNVEVIRLLLAKGADVNAVSAPQSGLTVKNGPLALGFFTPLILAAAYGGPEAVRLLLNAGAKVNAKDVRGMTPLMLAIACDHADARVVRLLLEKGADAKLKERDGESAVDWAKKFNYSPVLQALDLSPKQPGAATVLPVQGREPFSPKQAVEKSVALLQRSSGTFFKEGGCVACHAQNLVATATSVARANGIQTDAADAAQQLKGLSFFWTSQDQPLLQRMDLPAGIDIPIYSLLHISAEGGAPDRATNAMVHNIAAQQLEAGNWHVGGIARPPMEDGDFSRTAMAIRALRLFGMEARKAEFTERIKRAAAWLLAADPRTTEDRNMQVLGLKWASADGASINRRVSEIKALQRSDGGWAQTPELASDAYATGQTLYTLHESAIPVTDPAYKRGAAYLLRTQLEDGSWHVSSRSPKFQPYFQSGFPHGHDQWISASATAWATMGLAYAAAPTASRAATL